MCRAELGGYTVGPLCVEPADGSLINADALRAKEAEHDTRHRQSPKCLSLDKCQFGPVHADGCTVAQWRS